MTVADRKYAMTRITAGDYLLPSNDGKTLWRITEYEEDGSAEFSSDGKTWHPVRGSFWQTAKYRDPLPSSGELPEGFLDWDRWECWETGLLKRKYAVEAVLRNQQPSGLTPEGTSA